MQEGGGSPETLTMLGEVQVVALNSDAGCAQPAHAPWVSLSGPPPMQLADASWIKYIMPKGFVSVDGCSLTVGEVTSTSFSVYLIPETQR